MHPAILITIISIGVIALLVLAIQLLRFYMLKPGNRNSEMEKYKNVKFAHRGLHDGERAENSLSAFSAAKAHGYGIEFDLRLSADGVLVVHHDATLSRSCGIDRRVIDMTREELSALSLFGTSDGVPTFSELLKLVDGAIPMLIELKQAHGESGVAEAFLREIEGYTGEFIVESFNPGVLRKVKKARPDILIGILSYNYSSEERFRGKILFKLLEKLYLNFLMRPDFIAYEKGGFDTYTLRYIRRKFNTPLIAWTVRSESEQIKALGDGFDTVIFENYIPGDKEG